MLVQDPPLDARLIGRLAEIALFGAAHDQDSGRYHGPTLGRYVLLHPLGMGAMSAEKSGVAFTLLPLLVAWGATASRCTTIPSITMNQRSTSVRSWNPRASSCGSRTPTTYGAGPSSRSTRASPRALGTNQVSVARILGRITVVVHSEFGRRADGNGTNGTDHGYGGTALVMDASIKTKVITSGYFPNDAAHAFYSGIYVPSPGQEAFLIPKVVDVRQVIGEALRFRLGLTNAQLKDGAGAVFPGYSIPDNGNLVLNLI